MIHMAVHVCTCTCIAILQKNSTQYIELYTCFQRWSLPLTSHGVRCPCENFAKLTSENSSTRRGRIYFPLPEPGDWYAGFYAQCFTEKGSV